jgi:hypothetical protein
LRVYNLGGKSVLPLGERLIWLNHHSLPKKLAAVLETIGEQKDGRYVVTE